MVGFVIALIAVFLVGVFLKWWIVGCVAAVIALMFANFKEMAGLIPLALAGVLVAGILCRLGVQTVRHWDDMTVDRFLHDYVID